jgi:hypothetical protein
MGSQVDAYIDEQKSPQKEILQEVRRIFKETLPSCEERTAWGVVTFAGGKFYVAAMKNRVHVGFAVAGLSPEEMNLFEGTGKTMRHIKIQTLEGLDKASLVKLIRMVDEKAICKPC